MFHLHYDTHLEHLAERHGIAANLEFLMPTHSALGREVLRYSSR